MLFVCGDKVTEGGGDLVAVSLLSFVLCTGLS